MFLNFIYQILKSVFFTSIFGIIFYYYAFFGRETKIVSEKC